MSSRRRSTLEEYYLIVHGMLVRQQIALQILRELVEHGGPILMYTQYLSQQMLDDVSLTGVMCEWRSNMSRNC